MAREAGVRTKVAVYSAQTGVDPVGSCVGQKGVRVQAVTNEIGGERVDVIPWSEDTSELIKASLAPAEDLSVSIDEEKKIAKVTAPEDQLSVAIGKDGQNVRLTAKLTGYRIEVEGVGKEVPQVKQAEQEENKEEPKTVEEKIEQKEDVMESSQPEQNNETVSQSDSEAAEESKKSE
ncbi:MAG: hypothetical protein QUS12_01125 [Methanosarcina sp.]|nr:hypothetical protein [Methanosarcina sp.]